MGGSSVAGEEGDSYISGEPSDDMKTGRAAVETAAEKRHKSRERPADVVWWAFEAQCSARIGKGHKTHPGATGRKIEISLKRRGGSAYAVHGISPLTDVRISTW